VVDYSGFDCAVAPAEKSPPSPSELIAPENRGQQHEEGQGHTDSLAETLEQWRSNREDRVAMGTALGEK
jgi:hypothetical protein